MNSFIRTIALSAVIVASGLAGASFAEDAMATPMASDAMSASPMATTPMAGGAMAADPMAAAATDECRAKAKAETDATKMATMMAECDATATPMAPDAMATPMAPDAMAAPATK